MNLQLKITKNTKLQYKYNLEYTYNYNTVTILFFLYYSKPYMIMNS